MAPRGRPVVQNERVTRRIHGWAAAPLLALLLAACTPGASPEPTASDAPPAATDAAPAQFTPIIATALAEPVAAPATDGLTHLAYELQLTNVVDGAVTLAALDVVDGDGNVVQSLTSDGIAERLLRVGDTASAGATLASGATAVLLLDVAVPDDAVPAALAHELTVQPANPHPPVFGEELTERLAPVEVDASGPIVIGSPLAGADWLDGNSCCGMTPHRMSVNAVDGSYHVPERFAIDFVQLDAAGRTFDGPVDELSSYWYEGAELLAVADATVVRVVSDRAEQTPGRNPDGGLTLDEYGGNYVVLDLGDGVYAFYAHLQPGNAAGIAVGDRVSRGDVVGYLGNSGNSSGPHLHFHLMDSPEPLASNGLPYAFDDVELQGEVAQGSLDPCLDGALACELDTADAGDRAGRVLLTGDVVDFGAAG